MSTENFGKIEKRLLLLQKIGPDRAWKQESRALLMSRFEQRASVKKVYWQWALACLVVLVLLTSLTSMVAANSLPGELFYPVKRSYERVRLTFSQEGQQLTVHNTLVDRRVEELVRVVEDNNQQSSQALTEVENSVTEINETVQQERAKLESMRASGEDAPEIKENLASLVPAIEQKQTQLSALESNLPQESQEKVATIINQLEDLKTTITLTVEPEVKGIDDTSETTPERPLLQIPQ